MSSKIAVRDYHFKNSKFAYFALVFATIAILLAITPNVLDTLTPQPVESTKTKITKLIQFAIEIKANPTLNKAASRVFSDKKYSISNIAFNGSLALAILGILFSIFSYVRQENKRIYIGSFAVSFLTLFWNFMWIAIGLIVLSILFKFIEDIF